MLCGFDKEAAARFSFWIAIPAIAGAAFFKFDEGVHWVTSEAPVVFSGVIASALVGFLAIAFLLNVIKRGKLHIFGYYCLAIGLVAVVYSMWPAMVS